MKNNRLDPVLKELQMRTSRMIHRAIILVFLFSFFLSSAQDTRSLIRVEYFNMSGEKNLTATMMARQNRRLVRLENLSIDFLLVSDSVKVSLGTEVTNKEGQAILQLPADLESTDGIFTFEASFDGNDVYKNASRSIDIKDVKMNISFAQEDDDKLIHVDVSEILETGELSPIDDVSVKYYVPRTFTLLPIGEGDIIQGKGNLEFPITLPGDTLGTLTVVAKIEDHDEYGNVEDSESINWGKPVPLMKQEHRGLGDVNAPLWMVYTLIVLLSVVWLHYLYSLYAIYLINKEGKKPDIMEANA